MHKIIRTRKATIQGKRKGEKKWKKKKRQEEDSKTAAIYNHQERKPQSR